MVEPRQERRKEESEFDERYMGLSRSEVALRERMAKKFGRKAQHLDATKKQPELEENKAAGISRKISEPQQQVCQQQPRLDPSQKLKQLRMDNERYRASIENSHQLFQASIGELPRQASMGEQPSYQYKYMKTDSSISGVSQQQYVGQPAENSMVQEPQTVQVSGDSAAQQTESSRKNLELLKSILSDYSTEELEQEIFTLNEVTVQVAKPQKQTRKSTKQQATTVEPAQPSGRQQIVLNEKQFNLIKKVYPQAFQVRPLGPMTQGMMMANSSTQFSLQDPQLIIQFFANMKALHRSMQDELPQ